MRQFCTSRPDILTELLSSGNPATNTPLISARLGPYNIINVQEDFNYHAALYASDKHAYRTPTSGGAGIGSGLNTLSDFPYIEFERIKWNNCNMNGGDCITPKGFTFLRARIAEGAWVDVYNLHTDAGSESGDIEARKKNFAQLAEYIQKWSPGMPVIVMGDGNARYTRPGDGETLRSFVSQTSTEDLWVETVKGGVPPPSGTDALVCAYPFTSTASQAEIQGCEVVDKLMVLRTSPSLSFTSATYKNDHTSFVDSAGLPLSDHYPLLGTLTWKLSDTLRLGDVAGGPHGEVFNDAAAFQWGSSSPKLVEITLRGANRVDGLTYLVGSSRITHGGSGGSPTTLHLSSTNERVVEVQLCQAKYSDSTRVFYAKLTTDLGRSISVGKTTSDCVVSKAPSGGSVGKRWGLVGFWGRDGSEIDRAGPVWGAVY